MTGITPDIFILRGRFVPWPPYILRPTTRFAYWIGILLSELVNQMIPTMIVSEIVKERTARTIPNVMEVINTSASSNYFLPFNVTSRTPVTSLHRSQNLTRHMLILYSIQSLHNQKDIEWRLLLTPFNRWRRRTFYKFSQCQIDYKWWYKILNLCRLTHDPCVKLPAFPWH